MKANRFSHFDYLNAMVMGYDKDGKDVFYARVRFQDNAMEVIKRAAAMVAAHNHDLDPRHQVRVESFELSGWWRS